MDNKSYTIALTGSTGQIGYALSFLLPANFALAHLNLHFIDTKEANAKLEGIKAELFDAGFSNVTVRSFTSYEGFKGADYIILIGAAPRTAGMKRQDLLQKNGLIFKDLAKHLYLASSKVKVLVVGNPCNTNALITATCSALPKEHFFALTMLDHMRATAQAALVLNQTYNNTLPVYVFGNHSSTMYPYFKHALPKASQEQINKLSTIVKHRGQQVIALRGLSSANSAAMAIINTLKGFMGHMPISVASFSKNPYGISEDVCFSYPTDFSAGKKIIQLPLDDTDLSCLKDSEQELKNELAIIKSLKII